jgi:hypothetical protein
MGTGKHHLRESREVAGTRQPDGDSFYPRLENEERNRVPEIEGSGSMSTGAEGSGRRDDQAGIRRPERGILPVRSDREESRCSEDERLPAEGNIDGASISNSSRGSGTEEDASEAGKRKKRDGKEVVNGAVGTISSDGSDSESYAEASRCWLDQFRPCESSCHAYVKGQKEPCRLLSALEKMSTFLSAGRRPVAPPPPKVQ